MTPELRFILEGAAALVAFTVVLLHHRRAMARVLREAEDHRRAAPVPQVTVLPAQVTVHPPLVTLQVTESKASAPEPLPALPLPKPVPLPAPPAPPPPPLPPAAPPMPEHEVCSLCCAAVMATRERAACHSVPFTPDQVRKAALQMARRMAKGPLPADVEQRIRKELDHG